jgi:hypothetical protein
VAARKLHRRFICFNRRVKAFQVQPAGQFPNLANRIIFRDKLFDTDRAEQELLSIYKLDFRAACQ